MAVQCESAGQCHQDRNASTESRSQALVRRQCSPSRRSRDAMVKLRSGTLTEPSTPIRKKAKANAGDTNMTRTTSHQFTFAFIGWKGSTSIWSDIVILIVAFYAMRALPRPPVAGAGPSNPVNKSPLAADRIRRRGVHLDSPPRRSPRFDTPGVRRSGKRSPPAPGYAHYDSDGAWHSSPSY